MIQVEDVLSKNKKDAQIQSEQNEEIMRTGSVKAKKQSYTPYIILGVAAVGLGIWLWIKSKKENGAISD